MHEPQRERVSASLFIYCLLYIYFVGIAIFPINHEWHNSLLL